MTFFLANLNTVDSCNVTTVQELSGQLATSNIAIQYCTVCQLATPQAQRRRYRFCSNNECNYSNVSEKGRLFSQCTEEGHHVMKNMSSCVADSGSFSQEKAAVSAN